MPLSLQTVLIAVAALGGVLGLIVLAARGLQAAGLARPSTGQRLRIKETLSLDRTRRVHLVTCDNQEMLLLTGGASERFIGWLPASMPAMAEVSKP